MKTLIISFALLTTLNVQASSKSYEKMLKEIKALETSGNYKRGSLQAAIYANQIAESSGFDGVVRSIENTFTENREEVLASHHEMNGGFSFFMGLLGSGSADLSYDVTRIVTTNSDEVEKFSKLKNKNFKRLQSQLKAYVAKHESSMIYAKLLAAKSFELSAVLEVESLLEIYPYITRVAQRVSAINFLGNQNVTNCINTNHSRKESKQGFDISLIFVSFDFSQTDVEEAYQERKCELSSVETSVSEFALNSMDLMTADRALQLFGKVLGLKMFSDISAPTYPKWGSPYME